MSLIKIYRLKTLLHILKGHTQGVPLQKFRLKFKLVHEINCTFQSYDYLHIESEI